MRLFLRRQFGGLSKVASGSGSRDVEDFEIDSEHDDKRDVERADR